MVFARLKKKLANKKAAKDQAAAGFAIPKKLPKPIEHEILDIIDKEEDDSLIFETKIYVVQQSSSYDNSMSSTSANFIVTDDEESSDSESSRPGIDHLLGSSSTFDEDESTTFTDEYSENTADSRYTGNARSANSKSVNSAHTDHSMCSDDSSDDDSAASNSVVGDKYDPNSIVDDTWDERCFPESDYKICGMTF